MAVFLLDTNVLLTLEWPTHPQNGAAHKWLRARGSNQWATCPITQCSFVRISSNPRFTADALSPIDAVIVLQRMISHPLHVFWEDDIAFALSPDIATIAIRGHQQVTDAYLLGLARSRQSYFATFDQGIPSLARSQNERDAIVLVPT